MREDLSINTDLIDVEDEEDYDVWLPFIYGLTSEPI